MSRVGSSPIIIPENVKVNINDSVISCEGPKGKMSRKFDAATTFNKVDNTIKVECAEKSKRAIWGTSRSILANMIKGVSEGFVTNLEVIGVGYRVSVKGSYLNLALGKSHMTKIQIPDLVKIEVVGNNKLNIASSDKQLLGQFVSIIISQRPPEPYKGKGIRKVGQYIHRKEGKKS